MNDCYSVHSMQTGWEGIDDTTWPTKTVTAVPAAKFFRRIEWNRVL